MQNSRIERDINNLTAQHTKLKQSLARIVQQTHDAVELKEGYLLEVDNLEQELLGMLKDKNQVALSVASMEEKLDFLHREYETVQALIEQSTKDAERKIATLDREISDRMARIDAVETNLENKEREAEEVLGTIVSAIESRSEMLDDVEEQIADAKVYYEELKEKTEEALSTLDTINAYCDDIEEKADQKIKDIKIREEELREIGNNTRERSKELDQREKDLKVYERRVVRAYEQTFPGRKAVL